MSEGAYGPGVTRTGLTAYCTLATIVVAAVYLTHWPTFSYFIRGGLDVFWYYVAVVVLVVPVFFAEPERTLRVARDPLFWWFLAYVLLGVVWLAVAQDFDVMGLERWRPRLAGLAIFFSIALLSGQANRNMVAWAIVGCVIFASATTWYDILRPYTFIAKEHEMATGRGAGLFINPNVAGSFIAAATILALPFVRMTFRGPLIVCAAVGIVPTFSRSSYIYAVLILVAPLALRMLNRWQSVFVLVVAPLLVFSAVASYDFLLSASDDRNLHNVVRRLEWFQGLEVEDDAVEGRVHGAREAWAIFLDSPLVGRGLGTTMAFDVAEGPHNMYLMLLAEQGFLGLVLYLSLIAIFFRQGRRLVKDAADLESRDIGNSMVLFSAMLFAWGFFDHNVLEQPFTMFLLGFAAAACMQARRAGPAYFQAPVSDFRRRGRAADIAPG